MSLKFTSHFDVIQETSNPHFDIAKLIIKGTKLKVAIINIFMFKFIYV